MTKPTGIEAQACRDIAKRQAKGSKKYGMTVAQNPLSKKQWAQHLYGEILDAAIYIKRLMRELE